MPSQPPHPSPSNAEMSDDVCVNATHLLRLSYASVSVPAPTESRVLVAGGDSASARGVLLPLPTAKRLLVDRIFGICNAAGLLVARSGDAPSGLRREASAVRTSRVSVYQGESMEQMTRGPEGAEKGCQSACRFALARRDGVRTILRTHASTAARS